jgi:PadR family transcriptional regulator PadR
LKGWIVSNWEISDQNRRAKYYSLTDEGRTRLHQEHSEWSQFAAAVARVMEGLPEEQS